MSAANAVGCLISFLFKYFAPRSPDSQVFCESEFIRDKAVLNYFASTHFALVAAIENKFPLQLSANRADGGMHSNTLTLECKH